MTDATRELHLSELLHRIRRHSSNREAQHDGCVHRRAARLAAKCDQIRFVQLDGQERALRPRSRNVSPDDRRAYREEVEERLELLRLVADGELEPNTLQERNNTAFQLWRLKLGEADLAVRERLCARVGQQCFHGPTAWEFVRDEILRRCVGQRCTEKQLREFAMCVPLGGLPAHPELTAEIARLHREGLTAELVFSFQERYPATARAIGLSRSTRIEPHDDGSGSDMGAAPDAAKHSKPSRTRKPDKGKPGPKPDKRIKERDALIVKLRAEGKSYKEIIPIVENKVPSVKITDTIARKAVSKSRDSAH